MQDIVILEGDDLKKFFEHIGNAAESNRVYRLRFAVEDGIKIKVNEYVWSPAYGKMEGK